MFVYLYCLNGKLMTKRNKLDKAFGPSGSGAGYLMLVAGLAVSYNYIGGVFLALVGAFVGFTSTSSLIDIEKKRIKFSNDIFGIIPTGKWIEVKPGMSLRIKKNHIGYTTFSRSNRRLDIHNRDFRIVLYSKNDEEMKPLKKFNSLDEAKKGLELLNAEFGLS